VGAAALSRSALGTSHRAFIGVTSDIGCFLWLYALKHESPTRATVFLALNAVTAALLGAWLLDEAITAWAGVAMALIAIGLWLATRSPSRRQR
jgi:drug/metabolite transporter (DMT)-like permease